MGIHCFRIRASHSYGLLLMILCAYLSLTALTEGKGPKVRKEAPTKSLVLRCGGGGCPDAKLVSLVVIYISFKQVHFLWKKKLLCTTCAYWLCLYGSPPVFQLEAPL